MKKVRLLLIGSEEWLKGAIFLLSKNDQYLLETINNERDAIERLSHNSYDILLIDNEFSETIESIKLAKLAYAMTRPSIIICSSILSYLQSKIWQYLSKFTNTFITSKKLINFSYGFHSINDQIDFLSKDYKKYFNVVKKEIKINTF